jgi:hypothetical protein
MKYIVPTSITDAMLVSSTVPESEYDEWNASVVYPAGHLVARSTQHSVFKRVSTGSSSDPPESDLINWTRVGPTNKWSCLDLAVGTATTVKGSGPTGSTDQVSMSYTIAPGQVRGLALMDMDANSLVVTMTSDGEDVYELNLSPMGPSEDVDNYYDYFFAAIVPRRLLVATDIPPYVNGRITVTLTGAGSVSLGSLIVGDVYQLGEVLSGASVGIIDFSRKERDDFGVITFAERSYARRMTLPLLLNTSAVDAAVNRLARFRARPVVWVGSPSSESLTVYGICRDFSMAIPGPMVSTCSLEIEGLV